ncbi:MAG TPA: ABC transporter permease [Terriglobales bacterium]|nr:ABC transporter permease [Terriglobales bacterium]
MNTLLQDLRYGLRVLLKRPGFALVTVLTLALGVGANTAIFSVVNGTLLRPLPYREAERVMTIWQKDLQAGKERDDASPANFADWRERAESFEAMAAVEPYGHNLTGQGEPENFRSWLASEGFFRVMGTDALHGRTFLPEEHAPGGPRAVVLSHGLWQRRFGGDAGLVGRTLLLNGRPHTVVGVMPPEFDYPAGRELWAARAVTERERQDRGSSYWQVVGRLKAGVTPEQARAEMDSIAAQLAEEYPQTNAAIKATVVPLGEQLTGHIRPALLVLLAAVGLVLLVACANVANLLLVRGVARRKEIAIRTALGATRGHLVRQLLAEALALGMAGAVIGSLLSFWAVAVVRVTAPATMPRLEEVQVNARVLAFALAAGLLSAMLFGLAPLLQAARGRLAEWLHERGGGGGMPSARRSQHILVVAEVSLALVLLVGAGLLVESFVRLRSVDPGFRREDVLTAKVMLPARRYGTREQQVTFVEDAIARLSALPGVLRVAITNAAPLADNREGTSFQIEGAPPWPRGQEPHVNWNIVTPGYFAVLGIPLAAGRAFDDRDRPDTPPVVMINETLASRHFPGENPIGRRIRVGFASGTPRVIVGVVKTERHAGMTAEPHNGVYVPMSQFPRAGQLTILARTASEPAASGPAVRQTIREIDPALAVFQVQPMSHVAADAIAAPRFSAVLLSTFASVALLLAAVGLYGVLSHAVSQRTREIGIRMALGASRGAVLQMVVGRGVALAGIGVAAGLIGAVVIVRAFATLLFGVSSTNLPTYVLSGFLLLLVGAGASYVPARRATRVDPVIALRTE